MTESPPLSSAPPTMPPPGRRQPRDACADRQLQGRRGSSQRHHAEAAAMNPTSAVSVAFDPLLPWSVMIGLAAVGLVLVLLGIRARARGMLWRSLAVIVVLAAVANPALIEEPR